MNNCGNIVCLQVISGAFATCQFVLPPDTCASLRVEDVFLIWRIIQMSTKQGMGVLRSWTSKNIICFIFGTQSSSDVAGGGVVLPPWVSGCSARQNGR
jgi:hypothetical protein